MAELKQRFSGELSQGQTEVLPQRHSVSSTRTHTSAYSGHELASSSPAHHSSAEVTGRLVRKKRPSRKENAKAGHGDSYGAQSVEPMDNEPLNEQATPRIPNTQPLTNPTSYTYEEMNISVDQLFFG